MSVIINWEMTGTDPHDLKAYVGNGNMLRVERMGIKNYWWCVYFNDIDWHSYDDAGSSLEDAKTKCEVKYFELLLKYKK